MTLTTEAMSDPDAGAAPAHEDAEVSPASRRRARRFGFIAGGIAAALVAGSILWPQVFAVIQRAGSGDAFPTRVDSYSWWTTPLATGEIDRALMVFQNGIGVEFMDSPQAVVLGADGTTYRRVTPSEARTIVADQGDPADMVLSADGTFVVIAGAGGHGDVELVRFADLDSRRIPVGEGLSAIPLSISADAAQLLVLTGDSALSPYESVDFALVGDLVRVDLDTGELVPLPAFGSVSSAAISPDGSRVAATTDRGELVVADADGGDLVRLEGDRSAKWLEGDAWSPDASLLALSTSRGIEVRDISTGIVVVAELPTGVDWAASVGWRGDSQLLVQADGPDEDNSAHFAWVDTATGEFTTASEYTPGYTGASLAGPDLARDLVGTIPFAPREADRGWLQTLSVLIPAGLAGLVVGLIVTAVTQRRSIRRGRLGR